MDEEARIITKKLNIYERVETTVVKEGFITLKDYKENFLNKPTCRLINSSKPVIGKISKQLLEEINRKLVNIKKVNQWKNTSSVLQWFGRLTNKSDLSFICFDVVEFYPSISEDLLNRALDFALEHHDKRSSIPSTPYCSAKASHGKRDAHHQISKSPWEATMEWRLVLRPVATKTTSWH